MGLLLDTTSDPLMPILIDPPVGPYSPPDDIRAWIAELREMAKRHAADALALQSIDRATADAKAWLTPDDGGTRG